MAIYVSLGTSAQDDVASTSVVVETETTTQPTTPTTNDDEVQVIGETQRSSSSSVMMPTTTVSPASHTTGPLQNHLFSSLFLIFYQIHDFNELLEGDMVTSSDSPEKLD